MIAAQCNAVLELEQAGLPNFCRLTLAQMHSLPGCEWHARLARRANGLHIGNWFQRLLLSLFIYSIFLLHLLAITFLSMCRKFNMA